jgi:hypothetical protein
MKFRLWTDNESYITYVFVGKETYEKHKTIFEKIENNKKLTELQIQKLKDEGISEYQNIKFIDKTIHTDDNISILLKRLCVYLDNTIPPEDMYLWINKPVVKNPGLVANFVNNCFRQYKKITFEELKTAAKNYFTDIVLKENDYNIIDRTTAFKLILESDFKHIIEPIQFRYTENEYFAYVPYNPLNVSNKIKIEKYGKNNYFAMTLQSFGEFDHINIVTYEDFKEFKHFFPYHDVRNLSKLDEIKDFIKNLDKLEDSLNIDTSSCDHKENISFLRFGVNEINFNKNIDLGKAFDKLTTNNDIPFIKYRTYTNVYYKVDKDFIKDIETYKKYWDKWTELGNVTKKYIDNTFLIFKIKMDPNVYCTLQIFDNFVYDIKFSIGKGRKTPIKRIYTFCEQNLNNILKELRSIYPESYIPDVTSKNMNIIKVTAVDSIALKGVTIKYENFKDTIQSTMFPYFNLLESKDRNRLVLQYKKVDNYMKYDNITAFVIERAYKPADEVITELSKWFRMTYADAKREYEKRQGEIVLEIKKEEDKKFYKPKVDSFVNIVINTSSPIDMDFEVREFKYFETHTRIIELLKVLIILTNNNKHDVIETSKIEKGLYTRIDDDGAIKLKDVDKDDIIIEEDGEKEEFKETGKVVVGELDDDYMALLDDYEQQEDAPEDKKEETKKTGLVGLEGILQKLKEGDFDLVSYKSQSKKREDYATKCTGRYPIIINKNQKDSIDSKHPGSYKNFLKTGSTPALANRNYYICPDVWCPKSMVSMTTSDYDANKCPFDGEKAIVFKEKYNYIGILPPSNHPKGHCVPCCFKKDTSKGSVKNRIDECKQSNPDLLYFNTEEHVETVKTIEEDVNKFNQNPKYIKKENNWPLPHGHYGVLPNELFKILGSKKCADNENGAGNMNVDSDCFLRQGSSNKEQSFLACLNDILDSDVDFKKLIEKNLTLEQFIALENGKILKAFINDRLDIFNPKYFQDFVKWFLNQRTYVIKFNLGKVYNVLKTSPKEFSKSLRYFKDIIREFMVYNSYYHFISYIKTNKCNDHRVLLDLFNSEHDVLNPKNINLVVIVIKDNKIYIQCPMNRNRDKLYDINHPFAFMIYNQTYYELLTKVTFTKKEKVTTKKTFRYATTTPEMQILIDFIMNNCFDVTPLPEKIIADIEIATGLKTKYLVIDYGFKIKGVLLKDNVYVPFEEKFAIFNLLRKRFIYYSDLINYKCVGDARKVYSNLKNPFYKIKTATDKYFILENNIVIPLNMKKSDIHYNIFEDDLDIFIGFEKEDPRKIIISIINENKKIFSVFLNAVLSHINSNSHIKAEINFITDHKNPFPMNFKRKKLADIMETIIDNVIIKPDTDIAKSIIDKYCEEGDNCVVPCPDPDYDKCLLGLPKEELDKFKFKVSEQLLINNNFYFDSRTKIFRYSTSELLFEHHDIVLEKHNDVINRIQDPFQILYEKLDNEFGDYIFDKNSEINVNYITEFIGNAPDFIKTYSKFKSYRHSLKNALVVQIQDYNNMYLYRWFSVLTKVINRDDIDPVYFKSLVKSHIVSDYETNTIENLLENMSFKAILKDSKDKSVYKPPLNKCTSIFESVHYYPSIYEIAIMADYIGINVIVLTRSSEKKKNESGIHFIDNRSSHYIILHHKYDSENSRDIYYVVGIHDGDVKLNLIKDNKIDLDKLNIKYVFNKPNIKDLVAVARNEGVLVELDVPDDILERARIDRQQEED